MEGRLVWQCVAVTAITVGRWASGPVGTTWTHLGLQGEASLNVCACDPREGGGAMLWAPIPLHPLTLY